MASDDGWAAALRFVDDLAALAERMVAEEVLKGIELSWPMWTGWSAANNYVVEGEADDFPLHPPIRPTEYGELFAYAEEVAQENQNFLAEHTTPGMISIGNAVPYAPDVAWIPENGTLIYQEAATTGTSIGMRRFLTEWQRHVKPPG